MRPLSGFMDFCRWPRYRRCPIISLAKLPPCVITKTSDFRQTKKSRAARLVTCFLKPSSSNLVASSSFVTCNILFKEIVKILHDNEKENLKYRRVNGLTRLGNMFLSGAMRIAHCPKHNSYLAWLERAPTFLALLKCQGPKMRPILQTKDK
ncbi:ribosomal L27e protein family [Striga asiatica]|uniref:Ribosomal L27e protein family n=1 Tax=Striga asiatica TaxID=4170 RepID=A0A5A7R5I2_STRAF|nr:ribosomal L27e protein family [Striga asiatica]